MRVSNRRPIKAESRLLLKQLVAERGLDKAAKSIDSQFETVKGALGGDLFMPKTAERLEAAIARETNGRLP